MKQSRPELRFLTERELETAVHMAGAHGDLLSVTVGTGLRFGEVSALWVGDVDLARRTIRVSKAWKRNGEDDATDTPGWLAKQRKPRHAMRDHHLGNPKTPKSRRTITISPTVAAVLARRTHVAWLVAGGAPLPHIQARLGHESITTTIETYGHQLPAGDELISGIIDTGLSGGTIRPKIGG